MKKKKVLFIIVLFTGLTGCLQQGGPAGTSPSGTSVNLGSGLLNPGGTIGGTSPGSSVGDPLASVSPSGGGPTAATQDSVSSDAVSSDTSGATDTTQVTPPDRPPSTAVPTPGDDCYNIVHRRGRWEDHPADPDVVARCEGKLRCVGYIVDRKQGIEVPLDEECEVLYQAEAEAWRKQMEEAMLPSPAWHPNDPRENRPNTPQQHPSIPLGSNVRNLGNGQQQFPTMKQPLLFSDSPTSLQP